MGEALKPAFIFLLAMVTSTAACTLTKGPMSVRQAFRDLFEWIGTSAFFIVLNVALGAAIILLVRTLTSRFIALYDLQSLLLVVFSVAQGFIFQMWWKRN
jgi:hypothetical protein